LQVEKEYQTADKDVQAVQGALEAAQAEFKAFEHKDTKVSGCMAALHVYKLTLRWH
jgi:hypothetical protein